MQKYVIEKRTEDGALDTSDPQPETVFGQRAVTGIGADEMAKIVYLHAPKGVQLRGTEIPSWPGHVHPRFRARPKTW